MHLPCHFERQDGLHRVDAAVGVGAREGEGGVLNVVVVSDQVSFENFRIFLVIGVVNDGVVVELLNCLSAGLIGEYLE